MTKKIFAVVAVLLVAALALVACATKPVLELYSEITQAKSAKQEITVKNGNDVVASETLNYNFADKTVSGTKKTLNPITEAEMWNETEVSYTIAGEFTAKLTADNVTDLKEELSKATCKVKHDALANVFGIEADEVNGDAELTFTIANAKVTELVVTYTSVTGNTVTMKTTFTY